MSRWELVYTEQVVIVIVTLLCSANVEYVSYYVPPDIFRFDHELEIAMEVALGSRANF